MVIRDRCALDPGYDNQMLAMEDRVRPVIAADWQGANGNSVVPNLAGMS